MVPSPPRYAREKLLHAIIFFTKKTRACHKTKLFKLLFYFDFTIFRETGRPATGLEYFAWEMGPVPRDLFEELESPRGDMGAALAIRSSAEEDPDFTGKRRLVIVPRVPFDESMFTERELKTLENLAVIYQEATASQMVEVTHLPGKPWHQVFEVQRQPFAPIPYLLSLDSEPGSISQEQADLIEEEAREAAALFE